MKERLPFDNLFNDRLRHHEATVPDDMFDRIMQARESKKPLAVAWWKTGSFRLLALIAMALLGSLSVYISTFEKPISVEKRTQNGQNTEGVIAPKSVLASSQMVDKNTTSSVLNKINSAFEKPNFSNKNTAHSSNFKNKKTTFQNSTVSNSTTITTTFSTNLTENSLVLVNQQLTTNSPQQIDFNEITNVNNLKLNKILIPEQLNALHTEGVALPPKNHDDLMNQLPTFMGPGDECPTFGNRGMGRKWYVDFFGSPELAMRRLQAVPIEFDDYRKARDTTEKAFLAVSAGVRASVVFNNGLAFRAGVMYGQNSEVFQRDSFGKQPPVYRIRQNSNGTLDTLSVEETSGIFRQTRYNTYQSIDVMIQAGYELPVTNMLTLGFNGGVNLNVWSARKATILGIDLLPLDASDNKNIFDNNLGVSLFGSVGSYWKLSSRWQFVAEPQIRVSLKPITTPDYPIRQSYTNVGLMLGLRYKLSN